MDIDGQETERFDIRLAPNPAATIEQEALDVAGVTLEQVQSYQPIELTMSLFVCAKCGCVDNTATSSYWMLTNEYMVDKFKYAKELQPYKGMGLCSECGRLATSPDGRDVVVPGKWHG